MPIRETNDSDLKTVFEVEEAAFGTDKEAILAVELLKDPTAKPLVSLLAFQDEKAIGHILFTKAHLTPEVPLSISILAPLAVIPDFQKQGVGGRLIEAGLKILSEMGVDLVFVLGHPEYYPRHGFAPAGKLGFEAPYPIPEKNADAWMVQALKPDIIQNHHGRVMCAEKMDRPEHRRE